MYLVEEIMRAVDVYVDGSYRSTDKTSAWAFCVIKDGILIHEAAGRILDKEKNQSNQIGGECEAVIQSLNWLTRNRCVGRFYHDYNGLKHWIADLFGGRAWKRNNPISKYYREYCLIHKDYISDFVKVKGHSGNKWNEYVDVLAESAV